jgi:hypothetical protein
MRHIPHVALVVGSLAGAVAVHPPVPPTSPPAVTITGTVQTLVREAARGVPTNGNDTVKVLRVGQSMVRLTDTSLPTVKDGVKVSVSVVPAADGKQHVLSYSRLNLPQLALSAAAPSPNNPSGPDVVRRVHRTRVAAPGTATLTAGATAPLTLAAGATISSAHQLYVALVVPKDLKADPKMTEVAVRAMVVKASAYWSSQTGGQVTFDTVKVLPVYVSAFACGTTNETRTSQTVSMWNEAQAKMPEAYGVDKHLVLVAPTGADSAGCSFGLGSIGGPQAVGNVVFVAGLDQSQLAHELGHNLGLYHSNSLRCGTADDKPVVGTTFPGCTTNPYDDLFDVMGYSGVTYGEGNLNAVHLDGMHMLPNAVRLITSSTPVSTVRLTPLSTATDGRTLKITDPAGANYFVEYRTNSGLDKVAALNPWKPSWGVRVLREDPAGPASGGSYELDATPTTFVNDYNRSIPVGNTFIAASRKLTIKVNAADATGATVTVTYGAVAATALPK